MAWIQEEGADERNLAHLKVDHGGHLKRHDDDGGTPQDEGRLACLKYFRHTPLNRTTYGSAKSWLHP
jgi:hypothetical protein